MKKNSLILLIISIFGCFAIVIALLWGLEQTIVVQLERIKPLLDSGDGFRYNGRLYVPIDEEPGV